MSRQIKESLAVVNKFNEIGLTLTNERQLYFQTHSES